jgi:hypothetical protein
MMILRPEFNEKIIQGHLLAPAVFMSRAPHPLSSALGSAILDKSFDSKAYIDLRPYLPIAQHLIRTICVPPYARRIDPNNICNTLIFAIVGRNEHGIEFDQVSMNNFL